MGFREVAVLCCQSTCNAQYCDKKSQQQASSAVPATDNPELICRQYRTWVPDHGPCGGQTKHHILD